MSDGLSILTAFVFNGTAMSILHDRHTALHDRRAMDFLAAFDAAITTIAILTSNIGRYGVTNLVNNAIHSTNCHTEKNTIS